MHSVMTKRGRKVLGRVRPKAPPQCLKLENYLKAAASAPPANTDWKPRALAALKRVYLNDQLGCCVISSKYHQLGLWTGNDAPAALEVKDSEVRSTYNRLKAGPGDSGCVITDVLDYMRARGIPVNGVPHKIDGYVGVNNGLADVVKWGTRLFGGLCLGLNLPEAWLDEDVWDLTASRIVGGHDVLAVGYDSAGVEVASWGGIYKITWPAFTAARWVEECYAILALDWYGPDKISPAHADLSALKTDLDKLGGGTLPDLPDEPPPAPEGDSFTLDHGLLAGTYTRVPKV